MMADAIVQQHTNTSIFGSKKQQLVADYSSSTTSSNSDLISTNMESLSINQHSQSMCDSGDDFSSSSDTHSNSSSYTSNRDAHLVNIINNNNNIQQQNGVAPHQQSSTGLTPISSPSQAHRVIPQSPNNNNNPLGGSTGIISTPKPFPLHEAAFKGEYDKLVSLLLFTQGNNKVTGGVNGSSGKQSSTPNNNSPLQGGEFVGVNSLDDKKTTALHHAAFNGHKQCVKLLLASGAYPDVADVDGCTPLHNAAFNGFKSVMVMLMDAGANINSTDIDLNTALHKATYSGFHKCAELLINSGAAVDARDAYGITPLLKAASNKHQKCLSLLIERGADVNSRDNADSTALHQACYKGSDRAITMLLQKGANVNSVDKEGYTPLHNAVFNGYEECSRILLDKGSNIDQRALDGCTPLHYAASNGFDQCVSLLIRRGCKLDIKDVKRGRTPLHYSASKGNLVCVELLIKTGADTNTKDINGKTPKNLTKNPDIIALLSTDDKKKTKSKSRPKRNTDSQVPITNKEQQDSLLNSSNHNHSNSISNSSSKSFPSSSEASILSNSTPKSWDVNVDNTILSASASISVNNSSSTPENSNNAQSPTTTTTTTTNHHATSSSQSPNGSISRSASSDSLSGEKESPENTPKLDIYGFVKTNSTVDGDGIRTKKTDKLERKWAKMCKNWPKFAKSNKLRDRLPKGIPSSVRSFVWQRLVNIQEIKNRSKVTYKELLERPPVPAIASQIQRDLNRTFPKHSFFVEKGGFGQQILCNILTAYSVYNPEVGYCQGMGFITCLLIIYMAEEDAFWVLVQLAEKYGMAEMWMPEFPYLQTCFRIFDSLLENQFPQLFSHIHKQNVFTPLFSSQWFICLLIYNLPFPVIVRIWDMFLYDGLIVIFAAALALFKIYEDQIIKSEFEEILSLLKFANGEEKTLRIDISSFMKIVVHYKHKIKHIDKEGLIRDPNVTVTSPSQHSS